MTAFRSVTAEAREILQFDPVEPGDHESLDRAFEALGSPGQIAIDVSRSLKKRRPEAAGTEDELSLPSEEIPVAALLRVSAAADRDVIEGVQADVARDLFSTGDRPVASVRHDSAVRLIAASLLDSDPLVQVASAAATLRLDSNNPLAYAILDEVSRDDRGEIAELSRAILATGRENETRRVEIEGPGRRRDASGDVAPDSALVHGTWARRKKWWRPHGELHNYLSVEEALFPQLYAGRQPFEWSGYFSFRAWKPVKKDWDRQQAADSLAWWTHRRLVELPDLIGHSYGGSLALLATQAEKDLRAVILLSPALHQSCLPDPDHYEQILHVTTRLDLILLADLANARILRSYPRVTEWAVKRTGLHGHGSTHDPALWAQSGLTDEVRDKWLPSLTPR